MVNFTESTKNCIRFMNIQLITNDKIVMINIVFYWSCEFLPKKLIHSVYSQRPVQKIQLPNTFLRLNPLC